MPLRIDAIEGGSDAVGARRQGRIGQHRFQPVRLGHGNDFGIGGGHHHAPDVGCKRPPAHLHHHGHPGDIGQRLARQALRAHAGWNDGDDRSRMHGSNKQKAGCPTRRGKMDFKPLYVLRNTGETISFRAHCRAL